MVKHTISRKINKARGQKSRRSKTILSETANAPPNSNLKLTDQDGFTLILSKKEKRFLKRAESDMMDSEEQTVTKAEPDQVEMENSVLLPEEEDNMDTQSVVSKRWIRGQLKGPRGGGINRLGCKKQDAALLRRALFHSKLISKTSESVPVDAAAVDRMTLIANWAATRNPTVAMSKRKKKRKKEKNAEPNKPNPTVFSVKSQLRTSANTVDLFRKMLPTF